jgi:molybdate transport system substrate-binding protein
MKSVLKPLLAALLLGIAASASFAESLNVFAAASLTESFTEIGAAYQKAYPGETVNFSFAGSPTLRAQIQQGAPADVFASADVDNMEPLTTGRLTGQSQIFAKNVMIVVVSKSSHIKSLSDLAGKGIRIVLAGAKVPAGHYADEILAKMTPTIAPNFSAKVLDNVVSRESNVKSVLTKVALGEADAGVVFATDAAAAKGKVNTIAIPLQYNVIATYPIAAVTASTHPSDAARFIAFVTGPTGKSYLKGHGFIVESKK